MAEAGPPPEPPPLPGMEAGVGVASTGPTVAGEAPGPWMQTSEALAGGTRTGHNLHMQPGAVPVQPGLQPGFAPAPMDALAGVPPAGMTTAAGPWQGQQPVQPAVGSGAAPMGLSARWVPLLKPYCGCSCHRS